MHKNVSKDIAELYNTTVKSDLFYIYINIILFITYYYTWCYTVI